MAERSANEQLFDATVRRKVAILRLEKGEAEKVLAILHDVERDLLDRIAGTLATGTEPYRLEQLLRSVQDIMASGLDRATESVQQVMAELAIEEAAWEKSAIERVSPIELNLASVALESLRAIARGSVQGLSIDRWFTGLSEQTVRRVERELRLAIAEGLTIDEVVRRLRGTRANGFRDGVLEATRRDAVAIARTGLAQASNGARQQVWEANSDVILCLRWTSVLDGRTTPICQSRDGHVAPVTDEQDIPADVRAPRLEPSTARPPAHINCRSIMVAVLDPLGIIGSRPFVADDRTRANREAAFRREAKDRGVSVQQVRQEWAKEKVGQLPAQTTYEEFFARQPAEFQRAVLGPTRYKMYKDGTPLGGFVDNSGRILTIQELRGMR